MKLIEFLDSVENFDGDLIVKNSYDSCFSFCWDNTTKLTKKGKERFKQILQSEITIDETVICLVDEDIKVEDYSLFMAASAGYVPEACYDNWFIIEEE